jgi:hypothetical protein
MRLACGRLYSFSDTRLLDCVSRTTLLAKKLAPGDRSQSKCSQQTELVAMLASARFVFRTVTSDPTQPCAARRTQILRCPHRSCLDGPVEWCR